MPGCWPCRLLIVTEQIEEASPHSEWGCTESSSEHRRHSLGPGPDRLRPSGVDHVFFDEPCIEIALDEMEVLQNLPIEGDGGMDPLDHELIESPAHG